METSPKILIGIITYDSDWYCLKQFAESIAQLDTAGLHTHILIVDNSDKDTYTKHLAKFFPNSTIIYYKPPDDKKGFDRFRHCELECRKQVKDYAIKHSFDYLFFIDSDVICDSDVLQKLYSRKKDIVCGLFRFVAPPAGRPVWFRKKLPIEISKETGVWHITFIHNEELKKCGSNLLEIDACGFGAILISQEILKKVKFQHSKNKHYGVDIHFCFDAKLLGYRIFGDPTAKCNHLYKQCARRRESNAQAF